MVDSQTPHHLNPSEHPPVDKKELWAWYAYDWASSVYGVIAIGIFMPVVMVDIASENAGCVDEEEEEEEEDDECDKFVHLGSIAMRPSAFAFYSITISVFFQAIFFITLASLADYGIYRKKLLLFFTIIGSAATCLYIILVNDSLWWLSGLLTILSNVFFGSSFVFYNAYLPLLVKSHPDVLAATEARKLEIEIKVSNEVSSRGIALGGAGAFALMIICVIVLLVEASQLGMRISIFLTGVWWFLFTIPFQMYVKPRPGPPLPDGANYITFGWKQVYKTFCEARKLPNTFKYLAAYMLYSDGYNTIGSVGILFGTIELGLDETGLVIVALIVPFSGVLGFLGKLGNFFFLWLQRQHGLRPMTIMKINLFTYFLLPIYGAIGFFAPFGLVTLAEFYVFAVVYGFHFGSVQSYSRTMFADLIPMGKESEFFGLYGISDKGSSWIGPLVISIILQATNSMRWSMFILILFFAIPLCILQFVDMDKGREEAKNYKSYEMVSQKSGHNSAASTQEISHDVTVELDDS